MYKLKLTAKAKLQLRKLSRLHKLSIQEIFEDLKENPSLGKPLSRDLINRFSYREGVYRIIYSVNQQDKIVTIWTANYRGRVYN